VKKRLPRVCLGPYEVGGYYALLAQGLRSCGVTCRYGVLVEHPFQFHLPPARGSRALALHLYRLLHIQRTNRCSRLFRWAILLAYGSAVLLYGMLSLPKTDVYIMGFGHSFAPFNLDLPLLRLLGKRVIVNVGHGCEFRPPYCDGSYQGADGVDQPSLPRLKRLAWLRHCRARWFECWANAVIGAPLSSSPFSSRPFVNWFELGIPLQLKPIHVDKVPREGCWRLLHSPSHPALKGTLLIREAVAKLRASGFPIDYTEIHARPNAEVLAALQSCDLLIDQTYSDTPMAGLAAEAAFYGCPTLVAGYGFEQLRSFVSQGQWPPSFLCHPDDLVSSLQHLLQSPDQLAAMGAAAQRFVGRCWSPSRVAARYLRVLQNSVPASWWVDPRAVHYLHGCGQSETQTRSTVRALLTRYGVSALQLRHQPLLEQAYVAFAAQLQQEGS